MLNLNVLSEKLLLQVKKGEETQDILAALDTVPINYLWEHLSSDDQKKAFWINCYNAYFQILRKEKKLAKPEIFRRRQIFIAGHAFSLDDIEHGILRRFRVKWSFGYLANPLASPLIRKLAVGKIDYRIHFALNCGARSCPPISFYRPELIEQQLDLATISFLESDTIILHEKRELHVTRLFQWFIADCGGKKGIRSLLSQILQVPIQGYRLVFKAYDWQEDPRGC
jgi:hypothetical protein